MFALEAESVAALRQLAQRCQRLGVAHGGVQDRGQYGAFLDIPDPDGTVLRFLANNPIKEGQFLVAGQPKGLGLHGRLADRPGCWACR